MELRRRSDKSGIKFKRVAKPRTRCCIVVQRRQRHAQAVLHPGVVGRNRNRSLQRLARRRQVFSLAVEISQVGQDMGMVGRMSPRMLQMSDRRVVAPGERKRPGKVECEVRIVGTLREGGFIVGDGGVDAAEIQTQFRQIGTDPSVLRGLRDGAFKQCQPLFRHAGLSEKNAFELQGFRMIGGLRQDGIIQFHSGFKCTIAVKLARIGDHRIQFAS